MPMEIVNDGNVGTEHEWSCAVERGATTRVRLRGNHEVTGIPVLKSALTVADARAAGWTTRWDHLWEDWDDDDGEGGTVRRSVSPERRAAAEKQTHVIQWTKAQRERIMRRLRPGGPGEVTIELTPQQALEFGVAGEIKTLERARPKRRGERVVKEDRTRYVRPKDRPRGGRVVAGGGRR